MGKILFYTRSPGKFATEITSTLAFSAAHRIDFIPVYSHAQFIEVLRTEQKNQLITILIVSSYDELDTLIAIKQIIETVPIVLILPDEHDDTLHRAHKLRPRFLSTVDHDFQDVLAVVEHLNSKLSKKYSYKS